MSLYVLDTDTLSLFGRGHPSVSAKVRTCQPGEVSITVITVEEQLAGWYTLLRRARQPADVARAYQRLADSVSLLAALPILTYPEPSIARFEHLASLRLNVANPDLRIAAIALENGATVVTRNLRDFQRVPGLTVEDWAS
jgi:tRNA(fMet)-specific endonuclease VapC